MATYELPREPIRAEGVNLQGGGVGYRHGDMSAGNGRQ